MPFVRAKYNSLLYEIGGTTAHTASLPVNPIQLVYRKSPHIRTYQNKNLEAVFPKLFTLQLRTCFSLMKDRF